MEEKELLEIFDPVYRYVNKYNIFEVRSIARAFGINAPTSVKKHDLIMRLIGVASGFSPPEKRSNKGAHVKASDAPPEQISSVRGLIDDCLAQMEYPMSEEPRIEFADVTKAGRLGDDGTAQGIVELGARGGRLRGPAGEAGEQDPVLSEKLVRDHGLRSGDIVGGYTAAAQGCPASLAQVVSVNGAAPLFVARPRFEECAAVYPEERLPLGAGGAALAAADLLCPLGKGQRAVVWAEPASGKTRFIFAAAGAVRAALPAAELLCLLPAFRPEEETEFCDAFPQAAVAAAAVGKPAAAFAARAVLLAERAKRVAESGGDAVLFIDSVAALERVFRAASPDPSLECEKIFAAGRKLRGGGSLTVIAVAPAKEGAAAVCGEDATAQLFLERGEDGFTFDFSRSFSKRGDALLTEEERAAAEELRAVLAAEGPAAALRRAGQLQR